jgi:hypothetical protein
VAARVPRRRHVDGAPAALATLFAIVPGVLSMKRAAAALVLITNNRSTRTIVRRVHVGLIVTGLVATLLPLL